MIEKRIYFVNKTVIITGGGTGIGYEIAKSFLEIGANVVIAGRRKEILSQALFKMSSEVNGAESRILTVSCDLSKEQDIENLFKKAILNFKPGSSIKVKSKQGE